MTEPIVNRGTLIVAVQDFLNRDDVPVPVLIQLAEEQFDSVVRYYKFVVRDTIVGTVDEEIEVLPADFLQLVSLRFKDSFVQPTYLAPQQLNMWIAENAGRLVGVPERYTIEGRAIRFDRSPAGKTIEIVSFVKVPKLYNATDDATNDLLLDYPSLYLYGALAQAEAYLKNDPRVPLWKALFSDRVQEVNRQTRQYLVPGPLTMSFERVF